MEMRTDGLQERNFITKTDIARAVQHLIALPNTQAGDGLFNLGVYGYGYSRTSTEEVRDGHSTTSARANHSRCSTFVL
jgi:hypothetical protein